MGQLLNMLLAFITRTVFIYTLSELYLGINGLFGSLLTVLSLTELGIGTAITYALYKPLAQDDRDMIKALTDFYKRAYQIIGFAVLLIGVGILPFLDKLITGSTDLANIRIVFLLYVLESVASYWFFAYKATLLTANQQKYIVTLFSCGTSILTALVRIGALFLLRTTPTIAFYSYSALGILGQIIKNALIGREVDRLFPYLNEGKSRKLTKEEKQPIFKNVVGMFINRVSGVMLTSVDNILISAFISILTVGIYSNYIAIKSYLAAFIDIIFGSIKDGIGDYCARETIEKQEEFFKTIVFTYFWIYGFCSICLWILIDPFITGIWHSPLLPRFAVLLFILNFLLDGLSGAVYQFRMANGLHWQMKYRYLFSAVFNGVLSYLLIKPLGVVGVLLGSTASILIMISFDPIIVYKNVFHKSAAPYYLSYLAYLTLIFATGAVVTAAALPFSEVTLVNFIVRMALCVVIPNGLWILIFRKSRHFSALKDYGMQLFRQFFKILGGKKKDVSA